MINLKRIICVLAIVFSVGLSACSETPPVKPEVTPDTKVVKDEYIEIITANKFTYHMVKDIVKDKQSVDYMLKTEEDEWKFEFTEDSLGNISKKDMFVYLGANYEPWVNKFIDEVKKGKVGIVNASRGIRLLALSKPVKYRDTEFKENPYYWLNPEDYKIALSNIKNSIQERDPKNRELYETNFNESVKQIDQYIKDYKSLGEDLKKYTIVTSGERFDYLIKYFNMKVIKVDEYSSSTSDQEKLNKKLAESKNFIYLYDKDENLQKANEIINKYKMTPVKLIIYKFDMKYIDILKYDLDTLKVNLQEQF